MRWSTCSPASLYAQINHCMNLSMNRLFVVRALACWDDMGPAKAGTTNEDLPMNRLFVVRALVRLTCQDRLKPALRTRTNACPALLALVALLLAGCGSRKPDAPVVPTNQAQAEERKIARSGPKSEGDIAWEVVMKSVQPPAAPPEWKTNPPGPEALAEFQKKQGALADATAT